MAPIDQFRIVDGQRRIFSAYFSASNTGITDNETLQEQVDLSPGFYGSITDSNSETFLVVSKDGKLLKGGNAQSVKGAQWVPGTVYSNPNRLGVYSGQTRYITDNLGQAYDGSSLAKESATKRLLPNTVYDGGVLTDGSGAMGTIGSTDDSLSKLVSWTNSSSVKLAPNQQNVYLYQWENRGVKLGYFVSDDEGILNFVGMSTAGQFSIKNLGVKGLTPGIVYGPSSSLYLTIADADGYFQYCDFESCEKLAANNIHIPAGTVVYGGDIIKSGLSDPGSFNFNRSLYVSGGDGHIYKWLMQRIEQNGSLVPQVSWKLVSDRFKVKPGQVIYENSGSDSVMALDDKGLVWEISGTRTYAYPASAISPDQTDCVSGQLPQSGDPAASWTQLVPYVTAVLAVAAAGVTLLLARRRASV